MPDYKALAKRALYRSGALALAHRVRNRATLTVAMFHRVLPPGDPRWAAAMPEWTVPAGAFEAALDFFTRHYEVVSLGRVLAAARGGAPLPPRALLVSFDDGYADNAECALPALQRRGLPAVVFVFGDALGRRALPWQEELYAAWVRGEVAEDELARIHRAACPGADPPPATGAATTGAAMMADLGRRAPPLPDATVDALFAGLRHPLARVTAPAQMVDLAQLRALRDGGVAIGAHGLTHCALPLAPDLARELREPRRVLSGALGVAPDEVRALSFPHGAYTPAVAERARAEGYELLFSSDAQLTPAPGGRPSGSVLGRINVSGTHHAGGGRLRPELLALSFFRAPHSAAEARGRFGLGAQSDLRAHALERQPATRSEQRQ